MSTFVADPPRAGRAVPVTVLTGFLGAGKTTLLNRILSGDHGLRVAVLVNDFGSINIDAELVVGVEGDIVSLANGCVCCSIRDDLVDAVTRMLDHPERPEYVLLEASGVADPTGIAVTFTDPGFRERIRLDSIACVVDAEQVFAAPEQMRLKLWQIACSDLLILNKVDLVARDHIAKIRTWLDEHFHRYRLIEATRCDVPLAILLSVGTFDAARLEPGPRDHDERACRDPDCAQHHSGTSRDHAHDFSTWSYETEQPMSLHTLREVASRLPTTIYRCKGVINSAEAPDQRAVLQVVGKRVEITLEDGWNGRSRASRIVAIGAHGTLNRDQLQATFDRCVAGLPPTLSSGTGKAQAAATSGSSHS